MAFHLQKTHFSTACMVAVLISLGAATTPRIAHALTLVVDADGRGNAANCDALDIAYSSIQAALNVAVPGDTIFVCPGTYAEQLVVTKSNLTIRGSGAGATVLRPSAVTKNTTSILVGAPVAPVLLVDGATNVSIASLTIDGSLADSGAILRPNCPVVGFYQGIFYRNSSGTIESTHVTNFTSSAVCASGLRVESGNVLIQTNLFSRYGESGISCVGPNTQCSIVGNTVRGQGPVDGQNQSGIQIRAQAAGAISGNIITDHVLIGANGVPESSVGIFLAFAEPSSNPHLLQQNVFSNNQKDVQRVKSAQAF